MLLGFFVSRALLSISMMLFGLNGLIGTHPKHWLKQKWWLLGVLWVGMYFLSYFWSGDTGYWHTRCEVKLPILLMPLAFAFLPPFSFKQQKIFTIGLNVLLFAGVIYSLSFLFTDPEFYIKGYDYSHVLPTLIKNNHIVYSITLVAGIVWNVCFFPRVKDRWLQYALVILTVIFVIMIHVLAARTGLAGFYIFAILWSFYLLLKRKNKIIGLSIILLIVAGGVLSVRYVPTLRNRLDHFNYTVLMFRQGNMSGDYSDIGRYISYDLAIKLIKAHPLKGVGAGNILDSMKGGYDRWYPQVPEVQRLIPHNQFLTVAVACGLPAAILFIAWVFFPLFQLKRSRAGAFFLMMWSILLVPLLVDPALEIQFGVFVYLFFLLWQRHYFLNDGNLSASENK
jgi:O-antigen ligase